MKNVYLYKCHKCNIVNNQQLSYTCLKKLVILTGFHKFKTIIKSLTSLEIEITDMMKRWQHITKLQSELIQEKKLIDHGLDEAIASIATLKNLNMKYCHMLSYPTFHLIWNAKNLTIFQTQYNTHYPWHHLPHCPKQHYIIS